MVLRYFMVNGSRGLSRVFGERSLVYSYSIILLTCVWSLVIHPTIRSRMVERFVGAVLCRCFLSFEAILKIDLRASPCFLMNIWRSVDPYFL